jgi:predicted RNA-binding Zn-ribbon protein involved in translation (DUF1610 family)
MTTYLRVNLGRSVFDEYSEFVNVNGPLPVEAAIEMVSQPGSEAIWSRILNFAETLQPSISKRHEVPFALGYGLETLKDLCRSADQDISSGIRGLICEMLHNQDFLIAATQFAESAQRATPRPKSRTGSDMFRGFEVDYSIEEIDIDYLEEDESTSYRTKCCDVIAFRDEEGNLFCPECGGLVFFSDNFLGRCFNCGMQDFDYSGRCEACGYYAGPPECKFF